MIVHSIFDKILDQSTSELVFLLDLKGEREQARSLIDSEAFRYQRRSLLLARELISQEGKVRKDRLLFLQALLQRGHLFYPDGEQDEEQRSHWLSILQVLISDRLLLKQVERFSVPLCHEWATDLVRHTLGIWEDRPLEDKEVRIAVLSTLFSQLRQAVGSCFATAPAILIQKQQPHLLLQDLYELLTKGTLTRVVEGREYSVPLSPTTGSEGLHRKSFALPALVAALQAVSVPLFPLPDPSQAKDVEAYLHEALLSRFSLQEEDLVLYKKIEASWALGKAPAGQGGLAGSMSALKMRSCEAFLKAEKKAQAAFKSFFANPLLRAWEYTIASFSETKMTFSQWNLYTSLGLHPEEEGGIGAVIYGVLSDRLKSTQEEASLSQQEYEIAYDQVTLIETLLSRASTEEEGRRLKAEHALRLHHLQNCQARVEELRARMNLVVQFFPRLIKGYEQQFQEYFQEIYDAKMQDGQEDSYEDSQAGFRLVYKHGRRNAFLWTMICEAKQYREVLSDFFYRMESQLDVDKEHEKEERFLLGRITTEILSHIRTDFFLETALLRMAKVHGVPLPKDPLKEIEKMEKKPWAYTSGGSLDHLLMMYYKREKPLTIEAKWVENETELLTFLLDSLKGVSLAVEEHFLKEEKAVLVTSPSHAFLLYPHLSPFCEGWQEKMFTYSWVRDEVVVKGKQFYQPLTVDEQTFLLEEFAKESPPSLAHELRRMKPLGERTVPQFRNELLSAFSHTLTQDLVDGFLYESLPLVSLPIWRQKVREMGRADLDLSYSFPYLTAKTALTQVKALFLLDMRRVDLPFDLHEKAVEDLRKEGLLPPAPLIFADTNWSSFYFAFLVNPGTLELELWRVNKTGTKGRPMSSWKHWFQEKGPAGAWHLYLNPFEYVL